MSPDEVWTKAADNLLRIEGGKVTDHAGPTNMGITLRFLSQAGTVDLDADGFLDGDYDRDGDIDQDDLNQMTAAEALALYKRTFWDRYDYGMLHANPHVGIKLFDLAVNCGPRQAHKFLQRAARACSPGNADLVDDGLIGKRTLHAINQCNGSSLLAAMRSEAAGFYRLLVIKKPDLDVFLNGWLRRAYDL